MRTIRDLRVPVFVSTILAIGLLGYLLTQPWLNDDRHMVKPASRLTIADPNALTVGAGQAGAAQADPDFVAGVAQLQAGNAAVALISFTRFVAKAPLVPEAQVNLGFTYLELGRLKKAEEAFQRALQLRPAQANAYYGLGLVYEQYNDLELARGAMRSFIHLSGESDPYVRLAQSALWEWGQGQVEQKSVKTE